MSQLDTLPEQFDRLLEGIDSVNSLEEWRYAFRKVIYSGAMEILRDFPEIVVGPPPIPSSEQQQQQKQQQQSQQQEQQQEQRRPPPGGGATVGKPVRHPIIEGQQPPYRPSAIHELLCISLGTCHQEN
jgi:hypothetical protein